ncbi:polygalacturonase [Neobacillus niacini]|nr:glycosyl hydrolase family 28-related protein [Neobacillus niacini]MDQ1000314.1 polygalacturonase [Neobacillus niacini]
MVKYDDTAAIQAAINSNSEIVLIPKGTYLVSFLHL